MIVYKDIEQRSPEWYAIRRGVLTASKYDEVITPTGKLADSERSRKFIRDLVIDCCIGENEHKDNAQRLLDRKFDVQWGKDHEDVARDWFRDNVAPVSTVGFVKWGKGIPVGCSPDGLIPHGENIDEWHSGLEIKCPAPDTHVAYLEAGVLPKAYKLQVHGSMAVTDLDSWWFLSYHPKIRPFHLEVKRDEFTTKVWHALADFVDVYRAEFARLSEVIGAKEVAA